MGKWNEEAAPNNNMASEELAASNLTSSADLVNGNNKKDSAKGELKNPGNRRTV
ncbi:hypothetical protein LIT38_21205 [Bacillus sp. CMF12]|uniref:hypothetical protein n=1 Tax=Bacillaceae TaxID=186817 RepID=UPI001FB45445|nr:MULTISPECIES: hypothetical protein [Bacillaceae]UOE54515.1 hypothetical protein IRB79_22285 [Cytobacillus oceanisediminis]USK49026.1 hypothetical protein LIT38_21205 [Bacillus sp. CMF12]